MPTKLKYLFWISTFLLLLTSVFSYSYVDLNLTLVKNSFVLKLISSLQTVAYYKRLLATFIYLSLIITLFSAFGYLLYQTYCNSPFLPTIKKIVIISTLIMILAYPFLSADLFNYLFDAKIVWHYGQNPYTHKPLDFPQDEWLRFMRWVHRYSPYGPVWISISLIPAVLGFGKFILNLLAFKFFIGSFHIVNSYLIYQILKKTNPKYLFPGLIFYALNPLFLIEGVANAHNDIVQMSFILLSVYFLTSNNKVKSAVTIILSSLIKYISVLMIPAFLAKIFKPDIKLEQLVLLSLGVIFLFTFIYSTFGLKVPFVPQGSTQVQFQPWYLLWSLPLVALIPYPPLIIVSIVLSFGASLRYLPYLYYGDWTHPGTIMFMQLVTVVPFTAVAILTLPKIINVIKKVQD